MYPSNILLFGQCTDEHDFVIIIYSSRNRERNKEIEGELL